MHLLSRAADRGANAGRSPSNLIDCGSYSTERVSDADARTDRQTDRRTALQVGHTSEIPQTTYDSTRALAPTTHAPHDICLTGHTGPRDCNQPSNNLLLFLQRFASPTGCHIEVHMARRPFSRLSDHDAGRTHISINLR